MDVFSLVGLIISCILVLSLFILIQKTSNGQLRKMFKCTLLTMFIWCFSLALQIIFADSAIEAIKFEYLASFGACFTPVALMFVGILFAKTKIKRSPFYFILLIIPITSIIMLLTNEHHNLFYVTYSTERTGTVYGSYFPIHSIYSYGCIFIAVGYLMYYTIKNSGFFSKQSILILIGTIIPTILNILFTLDIINFSVYITPISFAIAIFMFAFAIFKFKFLKVTPIALQNIVDRISDSFIVLNENNKIIDYNKTFLDTFFNITNSNDFRDKDVNIIESLAKHFTDIDFNELIDTAILPEVEITEINKIFNVEITPIINRGNKIGTLILFKDVTQHIIDLQEIKNQQDILIERDRLASLGQLIGGISHNLKTPIMSISGAVEGISDLVKEYEVSVGNDLVTVEDHHEIASDMKEWLEKIKIHTAYMSDIITAVKGQASALSSGTKISFTISELMNRVNILMKHELKHALINFNVTYKTDKNTSLVGDINSLIQVINNLITNAIQAYKNPTSQNIDLTILEKNNNIVFAIQDYACGIPEKVQETLFKQMITTKGKNGTGLGLYMSYSTIKGQFNGDITFESIKGEGTTFYITLPLNKD